MSAIDTATVRVQPVYREEVSGPATTVDSSQLHLFEQEVQHRDDFQRLYAQRPDLLPPPPILAASSFVPKNLIEHLMRNKKDTAIGVKYETGDAITNLEAVMHTFLTPICPRISMTGDYTFTDHHSIILFESSLVRDVALSAAVQPDFETDQVMMQLVQARDVAVVGKALWADLRSPHLIKKVRNIFAVSTIKNYVST